MNLKKLKLLEREFLIKYPDGWQTEELKEMGKKFKLQKHIDYVHKVCSKENMKQGLGAYKDVMKVVSISAMVSVFEKVKFRDFVKEIDDTDKHEIMGSIFEMLHGDEEEGFNRLVSLLSFYKLAKWPIISVWLAYYDVNYQVFVKPTTVKKIINHLELEDIKYNSKPNYEFYTKYRKYLNELKTHVDKKVQVSNPAFSGFFMMTIN
ncbi:hypothetical protein KQ51_01838 [Candidatus Izimaplasma bacterium HR1]|jgi:hypothetical protein|uniref:hypothetical protein n=1 Tax=Candidatus Izimoplasma sp. HR1 TaxID=1541959 RepID=UPI0004F7D509|nr:hypothetical protein KQ51_01838 [Candidatus Izimaplasma bacterium HR1]